MLNKNISPIECEVVLKEIILNHLIEWEIQGPEIISILVEDNEEVRTLLKKLVSNDKDYLAHYAIEHRDGHKIDMVGAWEECTAKLKGE